MARANRQSNKYIDVAMSMSLERTKALAEATHWKAYALDQIKRTLKAETELILLTYPYSETPHARHS